MSARQKLISKLSEDSLGGVASLSDVDEAVQLVDAHAAEVLAEVTNPADAATTYAERLCICGEDSCPTWCPASVPTDERITEIRDGVGGPLTPRELSWLKGAAARHEMHVIGSRGGHWPLQDPAGGLLLTSQYLAAAVAVIERAGLAEEKASVPAPTATPTGPTGRVRQLLDAIRTARGVWTTGKAFEVYRLLPAHSDMPLGLIRNYARSDLRLLAAWGHLTVDETPGRREYRLNTRKDGRS